MKLTRKMLRTMILEEQKLMLEYGSGSLKNPGDYAIGAYFDVNMMKQFDQLMYDMYENAMEAAKADGLDGEEAYPEIMAAFEQLIEEAQSNMRH